MAVKLTLRHARFSFRGYGVLGFRAGSLEGIAPAWEFRPAAVTVSGFRVWGFGVSRCRAFLGQGVRIYGLVARSGCG